MSMKALHYNNPSTSSAGDPTHVYKEIQIFNNSDYDLAAPAQANFQQVSLSNVVDDASQYNLSVIRWSAQSSLPVAIPQMFLTSLATPPVVGTTVYTGNTEYAVGIYQSDTNYMINYVVYAPTRNQSNGTPIPLTQPQIVSDVYNNSYFYINNINEFLSYINAALEKCLTYTGTGKLTTLPGTVPKFAFNVAEGKIELMCENGDYGISKANPVPKFQVIMNTQLANIMASFNLDILAKQTYNIVKFYPGGQPTVVIPTPGNYFLFKPNDDFGRNSFNNPTVGGNTQVIDVLQQQNTSIPSICPVDSIELTTSTLPIASSFTGAPTFLGLPSQGANAISNVQPIMTSFQLGLNSGTEWSSGYIQYVSQGEYRLIDCLSKGPVVNFNISMSWRDKQGFVHPFYLPNGQSASMLLLFRKKSFNGSL